MANRKRKSLSSILKTQTSPSRMALTDLNPNVNGPSDDTTIFDFVEQKKKRRSLRRVSFAETYQVKEFLKDSERNDSVDSTTHPHHTQEQTNSSSDHRPGTSSGSGMGAGSSHQISGLETLLSGTISQEAKSLTAMQPTNEMPFNIQTNRISIGGQDISPEEKEFKSDFLKMFMATDSGGAASSNQAISWVVAAPSEHQEPPRLEQEDNTFKSNFLQAFMATSSTSQEPSRQPGEITRIFGTEDAGMDLTGCLTSMKPSSERAVKEEKMGEITRIFNGQEPGMNDDGMEMTSCVGGYNTEHFQRELKRPAAESTRIFSNEDNMDLTMCTNKSSVHLSQMHSSQFTQKTMNTTTFGGTMDFTAMLGKLSDSEVAKLPDESTGRLLAQVDELIGGGKPRPTVSEASSSNAVPRHTTALESSVFQRDFSRRPSTVLDTIQEVSSVNASFFNSTLGNKSLGAEENIVPKSVDQFIGEDMDITTGGNAPLVQSKPSTREQTRVFSSEDTTGAMEMTCAVGGLLANETLGLANAFAVKKAGTREDQTRVFPSDDGADMEMTCDVGGLVSTGRQSNVQSALQKTEIRENQTRVFSADEGGDMEMTCAGKGFISVKSEVLPESNLKHENMEDNTTRFHYTDNGNSDLTTCLGELPEGLAYQMKRKREAKKFDHPANRTDEKTQFFGATDAGDMDMTECLDQVPNVPQESFLSKIQSCGQVGKSGQAVVSSVARFSFGEETKLFKSEATADMELTQCRTNPLTTSKINTKISASSGTQLDDCTKLYHPDDNCDMELTGIQGKASARVVTRGANDFPPESHHRPVPGMDSTKMFQMGEPAGDMEMTACLSSLPSMRPGLQTLNEALQGKPEEQEKTHVFQSGECADMEMTTCIGSVSPRQQRMGKPVHQQELKRASDPSERTQIFPSGDGGDMEITMCLGSVQSVPSVQQSESSSHQQLRKGPDSFEKTQVFSSVDAPDMEMTTCIGSLRNAQETQSTAQPNQHKTGHEIHQDISTSATTDFEKTQLCFPGDAADMEMTTCVGSLPNHVQRTSGDISSVQASSQQAGHALPYGDIKMESEDKTVRFQSKGNGEMEMTACLGNLSDLHQRAFQNELMQSDDKTRVFHAEGADEMEMTECVGTIPATQYNLNQNEDIASHLLSQKRLSETSGVTDSQRNEDHTKHFQDNPEEAEMEVTTCRLPETAGMPSNDLLSPSTAERNTQRLFADNTTRMDLTQTSGSNTTNIIQIKAQEKPQLQLPTEVSNQQHSLNISCKLNVSEDVHEKTSDTYTLSSPTMKHGLGDLESGDSPAIPAEGRRSDTFTISNGKAEETEQVSHLEDQRVAIVGIGSAEVLERAETEIKEADPDLAREQRFARGSASSEGSAGSGDSCASFNLRDSIVLPDWICAEDEKGILDELPINHDNTEDLCITTASKRPRLDESTLAMSQISASSMMTADLSQLPSLPKDRPVSLSAFLQMFCEKNDLPVGKPSIMFPQKVAGPQTIGELLHESCITKPKTEMFKWAVDFLSPTIDKLRESVKKQEERYSTENPAVITELQNADPEKYVLIVQKVKALHKYCTTSTKSKLKQWRLKMINNTKSAMESSLKHMDTKMTKVTDSLTALDQQLEQLKTAENDLDEAIANLENWQLPTEEEKREWIENSQRLEEMTSELKEKEEALQEAERERGELEVTKMSLRTETTRLEEEREEMRRWEIERNNVNKDALLEDLRADIALAQSFQEWKLEAFCETAFRFSFLQNSIVMNVHYEDGRIADVSLDSRLADDASTSAKLAHSMFFSSVSTDKLKTLFPTRTSLPQMMQHLSEMACQSRLLETEVRKIDFWHPVTATNNRLSIKYSSIEAHSMFHIHLELQPGQYPFGKIPHSCTVKIGKISEEIVGSELDLVQPGWMYVTRLSNAMNNLLKKQAL